MKRIVSMALTLTMVLTVFCGVLTVGANAADAELDAVKNDGADVLVATKLVVTEVVDGKFTVNAYFKDNSEYGLTALFLTANWDKDKVEPVVVMRAGEPTTWDITSWVSYLDSYNGRPVDQSYKTMVGDKYFMYATAREATVAMTTYNSKIAVRYAPDANTADYFDEEGYFRVATCEFRVKDPSATEATISLDVVTGEVALDCNSENGKYNTMKYFVSSADKAYVENGSVTVNLSESKPLVTAQGAAVRMVAPTGLRFISKADTTSDAWKDVTEYGTIIRINGKDEAMIPAQPINKSGVFTGVVSNIVGDNCKVEIEGVPYTKDADGNVTKYSSLTRSIRAVAQMALEDPSVSYKDDVLALLNTYAGSN